MMTLMLMAVVAFSATATASACGPSYAAKGGDCNKAVQCKDVNLSVSFTLEQLADTPLVALVDLVPPDIQEVLATLDPNTTVSLDINGKACYNLVEKSRCGSTAVCLNLVWHGTIVIDISGMPEIVLDIRVAELQASAVIPKDSPEALDLTANLCIIGKATVGGASGEALDISSHVQLCIDDGNVTKLKVDPIHPCYHFCHPCQPCSKSWR